MSYRYVGIGAHTLSCFELYFFHCTAMFLTMYLCRIYSYFCLKYLFNFSHVMCRTLFCKGMCTLVFFLCQGFSMSIFFGKQCLENNVWKTWEENFSSCVVIPLRMIFCHSCLWVSYSEQQWCVKAQHVKIYCMNCLC